MSTKAYKKFIDVESTFSRSKFSHAFCTLTIMSESVAISVERISVAINVRIISAVVST